MNKVLKVKTHFDAAHKLVGYEGDCANLHGHRWEVICAFDANGQKDSVGMATDFKVLKRTINSVLPDHKYLNDWIKELARTAAPVNPTAENLADILFTKIGQEAGKIGACLMSIELFESPDCSVVVSR